MPTSPSSLWSVTTKCTARFRNINLIPFWYRVVKLPTYIMKGFPYILGSSNPWPIAVLMEPFSTSAFKVLIWIFATTTKICTRGSSTKAHAKGFYTNAPTPSYSLVPHIEFALMVEYRQYTSAPSIFRANSFGRWVVTHSLADSDFHGHRPAVFMNQHLLWYLMSVHLGALTQR